MSIKEVVEYSTLPKVREPKLTGDFPYLTYGVSNVSKDARAIMNIVESRYQGSHTPSSNTYLAQCTSQDEVIEYIGDRLPDVDCKNHLIFMKWDNGLLFSVK